MFYQVIGRLSRTPIPADTGDFRLLSPRALSALRGCVSATTLHEGLFSWVGFKRIAVPYHRHARVAGTSKFSLWRLWNFRWRALPALHRAVAGGDHLGWQRRRWPSYSVCG